MQNPRQKGNDITVPNHLTPRAPRTLFGILLPVCLLVLLAVPAAAAEIKNARAERDGEEMHFFYDLVGGGGGDRVVLTVSAGGKIHTSKTLHLEGDVGKVPSGEGKKIRWKIRDDFPAGLAEEPGWQLSVLGRTFRDPATGMEFVFVKGGCFSMGDSSAKGRADEVPPHEVCVDDFYLGKYEVTQGEWKKVMGDSPSVFKACGARCPVDSVSWRDAETFTRNLARLSGRGYRLPREAEWEYAARGGGRKQKWAGTSREKELKDFALLLVNSDGKLRPVGRKRPNELGLHDMSGSLWEWVYDYYDGNYYARSPRSNPTGPEKGLSRVQRGGSWTDQADDLRVTRRVRGKEGTRSVNVGFRVAFPAE